MPKHDDCADVNSPKGPDLKRAEPVKEYKGANIRNIPKNRGEAFRPDDSLVSFTLR